MEVFRGLNVPNISKPNEIVICTDDDDKTNMYDEDIADCLDIICEECIFYEDHKGIYEEYTKTKGKHTPLNECFNKENNMNTNISNVFDKTKEALLVEKHLGNQIGTSFIDGLVLADKKDDVLKEAKRLEKEEKDK